MKLTIIIPVLNERPTLSELLERVWNAPRTYLAEMEILVVDNGSTDGSLAIIQEFCAAHPPQDGRSIGLLHCALRGKGNAVRHGLRAAKGDVILIQDGDLEYDTADYPSLLRPLSEGTADLVLGSRHLSAGHWKIRSFDQSPLRSLLFNLGGMFFHSFFNLLYGVRLTDPTTMYKVFRKKCVDGLHFRAERFDFDYELLGKMIRRGYKPVEIPVSYCSRNFKQGKKIRIFSDPWTWIWAIVRFRFCSLKA